MKRLVLYTAIAFTAGLFVSGLTFAGSESYSGGKSAVEEQSAEMPTGIGGSEPQVGVQLNDDQISELQTLLQEEGYYAGQINGELDVETRSALEEFQRSEGLAATGEPDDETLRSLAPSAEQQEFFGLSPEFGEEKGMIEEQEPLEQREAVEPEPGEKSIQETPGAVD